MRYLLVVLSSDLVTEGTAGATSTLYLVVDTEITAVPTVVGRYYAQAHAQTAVDALNAQE